MSGSDEYPMTCSDCAERVKAINTWSCPLCRDRFCWHCSSHHSHIRENKTNHQRRVEAFMRGANHPVPSFPRVPNEEVRLLRAKLIYEETLEVLDAMGVEVLHSPGTEPKFTCVKEDGEVSLGHVLKELADCSVVVYGTISAFGAKDEPILKIVDNNNLSKIGPGAKWRSDGKLLKPDDYKPVSHDELEKNA